MLCRSIFALQGTLALLLLLCTGCDTSPTCASLCDRRAECGETVPDCVAQCEDTLAPYREHEECGEALDALLVCQDAALDSCESGGCDAELEAIIGCRSGDTMRCRTVCESAAGGSCGIVYLGLDCETWCLGTPVVAADRGCEAELEAQTACIESNASSPSCADDCETTVQAYAECFQQYCVDNPDDPDC